jgi:hypothetical protein
MEDRTDFNQILQARFPILFVNLSLLGYEHVHALLQNATKILDEEMSNIRQHLLDYKPATITQLFSLY